MTITVVSDKGVTVVTMSADGKSTSSPLCQILKALCCSPACCSVYKGLMQTDVTAALGTIQIMVGLFNIGLGPGRPCVRSDDFTFLGAVYWLGGVFIVTGIMSLLAGRFPSLFLVGFAVLMNIVGCVFAIIGIVQSAVDLAAAPATRMCAGYIVELQTDKCQSMANYFQRLLTTMDITLIVLAVLQMCVCISFAALGIKAVLNRKEEEGGNDVEYLQPQIKEVFLTSPGA